MKSKKVTYKELKQTMDSFIIELINVKRAVDYDHTLLLKYIESNGHDGKLTKFLKKESENDKQKLRDRDGEDRADGKGNKPIKRSKPKVKKSISKSKYTPV